MTLRGRLLLMPLCSALLLTGCGSDAVRGLTAGGTAETHNFRIHIPHTLYRAAEPETKLWDDSFLDRSGYMISVQDFDFGYEPEDFLGQEYAAGEAEYESGELGSRHYCGWTASGAEECVLKYAAGTQGRLLFAQATVPNRKVKRARSQMLDLLEHMEFIGRPLGAGSITADFAVIDYPETWTVSADSTAGIVMMHPAVNKNGVSLTVSTTDKPKDSAKALAEERIEMTAGQMPDFYSEAGVIERTVLGYDAYVARLRYGEPEDEYGCVIQDYAYIEAPQGVCVVSMYYGDPGAEEFLAALGTIKLTFNGE